MIPLILDPVMSSDSDGNVVNPATSELQDAIYEILERLAVLPAVRGIASDLRVTVLAAPSTAVTGPITNAQFVAASLVNNQYQQNVNAILGNINNISIT